MQYFGRIDCSLSQMYHSLLSINWSSLQQQKHHNYSQITVLLFNRVLFFQVRHCTPQSVQTPATKSLKEVMPPQKSSLILVPLKATRTKHSSGSSTICGICHFPPHVYLTVNPKQKMLVTSHGTNFPFCQTYLFYLIKLRGCASDVSSTCDTCYTCKDN